MSDIRPSSLVPVPPDRPQHPPSRRIAISGEAGNVFPIHAGVCDDVFPPADVDGGIRFLRALLISAAVSAAIWATTIAIGLMVARLR